MAMTGRGAFTTPLPELFLKPLEVDPAEIWQRIAAGVLDEADLLLVFVQDFDRQSERLEDVRRAIGLQRPYLHLAEALATELGLAAQRLLGDQAVRSRATGVNLVLHQVV